MSPISSAVSLKPLPNAPGPVSCFLFISNLSFSFSKSFVALSISFFVSVFMFFIFCSISSRTFFLSVLASFKAEYSAQSSSVFNSILPLTIS